ncbi:uncharacterized protein AB675_7571 [Cyphellophora attinorum]|uniref:Uncharacterized protein n=1 Tax=Cyphellophora attinorum TaxID=1664694 RepID=A0A0N1H523_9EURO|nr:uncharacterized protein AB675_7571 [Phialophora attinorum]KPI40613.1 hypothetical protein AB675_7571 [Phialophora attinorum]
MSANTNNDNNATTNNNQSSSLALSAPPHNSPQAPRPRRMSLHHGEIGPIPWEIEIHAPETEQEKELRERWDETGEYMKRYFDSKGNLMTSVGEVGEEYTREYLRARTLSENFRAMALKGQNVWGKQEKKIEAESQDDASMDIGDDEDVAMELSDGEEDEDTAPAGAIATTTAASGSVRLPAVAHAPEEAGSAPVPARVILAGRGEEWRAARHQRNVDAANKVVKQCCALGKMGFGCVCWMNAFDQ